MGLSFVDLDGTLLGGASSERRFILALARAGLLGPRQYAAALAFTLGALPRLGAEVAKHNKAYLAGLSVAEVTAFAETFVEERLLSELRGPLLARLRGEAAARPPLLLSGTLEMIAVPLAARIGFEGAIATRCASAGGRFLAAPPRCHPYGAEKLRQAEAAAGRAGVALSTCAAYADSFQDLALLEAVGRPVVVAPDRRLARVAEARGWEVLRFERPARRLPGRSSARPAGPS